ncbi:MAG TPA: NAD-dependent epimerase/dehydratase family protein [Actinophytocola sp.]|uniref:NAD-dependent epimerase/dehydratase family protein n=1 Tax=Actinophytocola sp. TaxID=1872138 RepID=UPI002DB5D111|nr:NAD-dependent epimerase/dehydratase family protein [Actinophytocola sp.]HEU5475244.1 NAD-dependent epimerase/dehydratase family protein [Actinophytocola sp.]
MALHTIVGAGAVGRTTANLLAERGERVRIVTRSGSGPQHPAIERVAADATDAERLTQLTTGAVALYNCASPQYHRWLTDWPPLATALLTAAERTGATLSVVSNLYLYGPVDGPITESTPLAAAHPKLKLRGDMWREALALHEAGRIRMTEVRGSDYLEANSIFSFALAKPLLAGKRAYLPLPLDVPHSWTAIADVARLLTTVSTDERAFGKAWHVPTQPPLTVRELAQRFTSAQGLPAATLSEVPYSVLWTMGLFSPMMRELRTTRYQFTAPYVLDSSAAQRTFDIAPSDLDVILKGIRSV